MKAEIYKIKDETEAKEIAKNTPVKSKRLKKSIKLLNFILVLVLILLMGVIVLFPLLLRFYFLEEDAFEENYNENKIMVHLKTKKGLVVSNIQKVNDVYAIAIDETSKLFFLPASNHPKCHNNSFVLVSKSKCHNDFRESSIYKITFTVCIALVAMAIYFQIWLATSVLRAEY